MPKCVWLPHPFLSERTVIDIEAGRPVAEVARDLAGDDPVIVRVNGEPPAPDAIVRPEDLVTVRRVPGAMDDPNTRGGAFIMSTALVALGVVFAGLGAVPLGLAMIGVGVIGFGSTAVVAGYQEYAKGQINDQDAGKVLSLRGGRNQVVQYGKVPLILGKHLIAPYYAAKPYTTLSGTDGEFQDLTLLFVVGVGALDLRNFRLGETLLATNVAGQTNGNVVIDGSFSESDLDITLEVRQANGASTTLYPKVIDEEAFNAELKSGKYITRTTPKNTTKIEFGFTAPRGLIRYGDKGDTTFSVSVQLSVEYKLTSSGSWTAATLTKTLESKKLCRFEWSSGAVTAGQYDVRVKRITADSTDEKTSDVVALSAMRFSTADDCVSAATRSLVTVVALRVRACEQLAGGVLEQLTVEASYIVPQYDGSGTGAAQWTTSAGDSGRAPNPAAAFLYALRGAGNPRPVPDAMVDWPALEAWYQWCDSNGFECNAVVANGTSMREMLRRIAATGRATLTVVDGKYSIVHDIQKSTVVQHITPRNSWGFTGQKAFDANIPHAVKATFLNADENWAQDEVIVYDSGYDEGSATRFETLELWGVTNSDQAWKQARYHIAVRRLRPETFTVTMDPEALVATRGDLVMVSHDVCLWGIAAGRLKSVTIVAGEVTAVAVDNACPMEAGKAYAVTFRTKTGATITRDVVTVAGEAVALTLASAISGSDLPEADDLFMFGEHDLQAVNCLVAGLEMADDMNVRLTLVEDAPGVYSCDSGEIPAFNSKITRPRKHASELIFVNVEKEDKGKETDGLFGHPMFTDFEEPPLDVDSVTAVAYRDFIRVYIGTLVPTVLSDAAQGFCLQCSKDEGSTWFDMMRAADGTGVVYTNTFDFYFNRSLDGYPEKTAESLGYAALSKYRWRAKAVNAAGIYSANWVYDLSVDVSNYLSWIPSTPSVTARCGNRNIVLQWIAQSTYGFDAYEVQVSKDAVNWYEPNTTDDPRASEDNWKTGGAGGKRDTGAELFAQALPLVGQGSYAPTDTTYYYRVRFRSIDSRLNSAYGTVTGVARGTDALDVVNKAIKEAGLDDLAVSTRTIAAGAVTATKISVASLAAINANMGLIHDGAMGIDTGGGTYSLNYWCLTNGAISGKTAGDVRFGNANNYVQFDAGTGVLSIKVTSFKVESLGASLRGTLSVSADGTIDSLTLPVSISTLVIGSDRCATYEQYNGHAFYINGVLRAFSTRNGLTVYPASLFTGCGYIAIGSSGDWGDGNSYPTIQQAGMTVSNYDSRYIMYGEPHIPFLYAGYGTVSGTLYKPGARIRFSSKASGASGTQHIFDVGCGNYASETSVDGIRIARDDKIICSFEGGATSYSTGVLNIGTVKLFGVSSGSLVQAGAINFYGSPVTDFEVGAASGLGLCLHGGGFSYLIAKASGTPSYTNVTYIGDYREGVVLCGYGTTGFFAPSSTYKVSINANIHMNEKSINYLYNAHWSGANGSIWIGARAGLLTGNTGTDYPTLKTDGQYIYLDAAGRYAFAIGSQSSSVCEIYGNQAVLAINHNSNAVCVGGNTVPSGYKMHVVGKLSVSDSVSVDGKLSFWEFNPDNFSVGATTKGDIAQALINKYGTSANWSIVCCLAVKVTSTGTSYVIFGAYLVDSSTVRFYGTRSLDTVTSHDWATSNTDACAISGWY